MTGCHPSLPQTAWTASTTAVWCSRRDSANTNTTRRTAAPPAATLEVAGLLAPRTITLPSSGQAARLADRGGQTAT